MRILILNTQDRGGGAEKVALNLHQVYRQRGHETRLLVRYKFGRPEDTLEIDPYAYTSRWGPYWAQLEKSVRRLPKFRGQYRLVDWLRRTAWPRRWLDAWQGLEDFNYPYSHHLTDEDDWRPDVIHAHNLHGDYFDLRGLSGLSRQVPVVWTLHDTWAFTGHCGYFLDCMGWRTGCGDCPDLDREPALRRDGTAKNWQRKRQVYAASRLAVATPSRWLMELVDQSMLQPWQRRVIPNGVDPTIYKPGDRSQARRHLNLADNSFICMFIAFSGSRPNPYKDYATVERAVRLVSARMPSINLNFVCIGGDKRDISDHRWRYVGFLSDPHEVSLYYHAADLLLHAAHGEVFGKIITEAMACGLPVVATAVGGIPELIMEGETGFLVPRGDSELMAQRIMELMERPDLCRRLRMAAAAHGRRAFDLKRQGEAYLQWFHELAAAYKRPPQRQL
jgi:glycosyltransferase involved in cell wall biosynthesis